MDELKSKSRAEGRPHDGILATDQRVISDKAVVIGVIV